jgi:uncharacterized protein YqeY
MSLYEDIEKDLKNSLKTKDEIRISTLRLIRSAIKYKEVEQRKKLEDEEILRVLSSLVKQHRDSIEEYGKGGREDLVQRETRELEILQSFMPAQLTEEELTPAVMRIIAELGASSMKDMGRVMKTAMERFAGQADGKKINEVVKKLLSP